MKKTFKDLQFKPHFNGLAATMNFDNDYGVSVVRFEGRYSSYGGNSGLWELAILYKDKLNYNTDITSDVLGWQTAQDVTDVMKKVQAL